MDLKFKQKSEIDKCNFTDFLSLYNWMPLYIYVNGQPMLFISFYNLIMTNITNGTILSFLQRNIIK